MKEIDEFAYGSYGDYSGVVFYSRLNDGSKLDRLTVSNFYIHPLFHGLLDRARREQGGDRVPRLVADWTTLTGWRAGGVATPVSPNDATEFAAALGQLGPADLAEHCSGGRVDDCLRCGAVIREFIDTLLAGGANLLVIEDD